ncbi:XdhC family protein [Paracoccus seriniphilus]|uniref:Xanthine dehydrogenase accessory factor n=2 Tax=Paracoccus seriniphilus TaxID=184748 RepID=A0A239Q2U0_9RHOB|nr:XdhC family protein [Paracoccus seriniphilus]WCR15861.1 XdhC family protein [Paracoccus seriniphilus]SNT76512.1 xanthine dehydrogenase accessory factor [Paracoccus seriniphilus]
MNERYQAMSLPDRIVSATAPKLPQLPASDAQSVLAALAEGGGVLAMLTGIEGRFYRPIGAMMAVLPDGNQVGQLSGGCVEGDIGLHATQLAAVGEETTLRYGAGSPFFDIRLPCGSGIEVTLLRVSGDQILPALQDLAQRRIATLELGSLPRVQVQPETRIVVTGEGNEAAAFATLAHAAGYDVFHAAIPELETVDEFTSIVLFFHDHQRETAILETALKSPAFWIGAQGSRLSQQRRLDTLRDRGIAESQLSRIRGPIGLIPQARDARTLAISVLAEIAAARP